MRLTFFIILSLAVSNLSLIAQKHRKGNTANISGETIEIKIPVRNKQEKAKNQPDEIKLLENSIQSELKDYTLEMQDQRYISDNVITEVHVDIKNTNGNSSLLVTYSYTLLNDTLKFQTDDFGPGKYLVNESNALQVTLAVMKKNIEGRLAKYVTTDKEIFISVNGSADAVTIKKVIPYGGEFGEPLTEDCDFEGKTRKMVVTTSQGISNNPTLAFLRSYAVRDYLENNIFQQKYSNLKFHLSSTVSGQRGGQFRRVSIEMFVNNAFK
jgi:hypothetical protein